MTLPCGVESRTMAPGSMSSLAKPSMMARNATGSIGLRAGVDAPIVVPDANAETTAADMSLLIITTLPRPIDRRRLTETRSSVCNWGGAVERGERPDQVHFEPALGCTDHTQMADGFHQITRTRQSPGWFCRD